MKASLRKAAYSIGLALGIALFLYQLYRGLEGFSDLALSPRLLSQLLSIAILATLTNLLPTFAWGTLMHAAGINMAWMEIVRGYPLSFIPRYIPGGIWGYVSRSEWLYRQASLRYPVSTLLSMVEIWIALTSVAMALSWGAIIEYLGLRFLWLWLLLLPVIPLSWLCLRGILRLRWVKGLISHEEDPLGGLVPSLRGYLATSGIYLIMWIGYGGILQIAASIYSSGPGSHLLQSSAYYALSWLAGFLAVFVPSGIGIREITLSGVMTAAAGMTLGSASAIAITLRFLTSLGELLWLATSQILARVRARAN